MFIKMILCRYFFRFIYIVLANFIFFIKLIKRYWMFTALCLVTFGLFIVYWIAHIIYSKFIATIKKDNSNK